MRFLMHVVRLCFLPHRFGGWSVALLQLNSVSQFALVSGWAVALRKRLAKWLVHATRADFGMCLVSPQSMGENAIALSEAIAGDWVIEALLVATDCETDAVWLTGWSDELSDGWTGTWILFWTMFMDGTVTVMQLKCWVTNATDASLDRGHQRVCDMPGLGPHSNTGVQRNGHVTEKWAISKGKSWWNEHKATK